MGAWIEIALIAVQGLSTPVAPLVGAWIEMKLKLKNLSLVLVAPLVGAWIEMKSLGLSVITCQSLPSWERGLKYLSVDF